MAAKVVKTTKKSTAVSARSKAKAASKVSKSSALPKYKELITEAIVSLAERGGSSRQALKSYIKEKYPVGDNFDTQFNLAVKRGLETEYFSQPKGPAGSIKLVKKVKSEPAPKKTVVSKPATVKKTSSKKAAGKVTKKTPAKKTPVKKPAKKSTKKPTKKSKK